MSINKKTSLLEGLTTKIAMIFALSLCVSKAGDSAEGEPAGEAVPAAELAAATEGNENLADEAGAVVEHVAPKVITKEVKVTEYKTGMGKMAMAAAGGGLVVGGIGTAVYCCIKPGKPDLSKMTIEMNDGLEAGAVAQFTATLGEQKSIFKFGETAFKNDFTIKGDKKHTMHAKVSELSKEKPL